MRNFLPQGKPVRVRGFLPDYQESFMLKETEYDGKRMSYMTNIGVNMGSWRVALSPHDSSHDKGLWAGGIFYSQQLAGRACENKSIRISMLNVKYTFPNQYICENTRYLLLVFRNVHRAPLALSLSTIKFERHPGHS